MKLKKLFALALAVCMMALAVPAAFAADLTLDYGTTPTTPVVEEYTPVVEVPTPVVYNTRTTSRATTALRSDELAAIKAVDADPDKLSIDKKIDTSFTPSESNAPYYKIDLFAEAKSKIEVETQAKAIDVILVLDRSGNMTADAMSDLIKAINGDGTDENKGFLANVKATAKDSRVAVVTYAGQGASRVISGTKDISNGAFVKLSEEASYETLRQEISSLTAISGADAYSNEGFAKAAQLFQSIPNDNANYSNPRIVVFFTAGIPGKYGKSWEDYETKESGRGESSRVYHAYNIAQESIHWSTILKAPKTDSTVNLNLSQQFWTWYYSWEDHGDSRTPESVFYVRNEYDYRIGCGATVYCIGLNLPKCEQNNHDEDGCSGTRVNEYLYRISSHRPDGSHVQNDKYNTWESELRNWGSTYKDVYTRNIKDRYSYAPASYYQVGSVSGISGMFEKIDVNVEQNQPITNVTVRDYLAPGFVPCDDQGTPLHDGDTFAGGTVVKDGDVYYIKWESVTLEPNKTKFTESIYVKPVDDYYGGNGVQTNIYGPSGLYSGDTLFASFPDCRTNVPVKAIDPAVQHQTVYLSNTADLLKLRESSIDSTLNGKNNVGVIVTYELKDGTNTIATYEIAKGATSGVWKRKADGAVITSWPVTPTECASYTLTCTVDGGTGNVSDPKSATATVHVLKPTVEAAETTTYISNTVSMPADTTEDNTVYDSHVIAWTDTTEGHAPAGVNVQPSVPDAAKLTWEFYDGETKVEQYKAINKECKELTAVLCINGNNYEKLYKNTYTVHVLTPNLKADSTKIYLGDDTNLNLLVQWNNWNACTHGKAKSDDVRIPSVICEFEGVVKPEVYTNTTCENLTATWTSGNYTTSAQFDVHVLWPTISVADDTIYLGDTSKLTASISGWTCNKHEDVTANQPTTGEFDFYDENGVEVTDWTVSPHDCAKYTAKLVLADQPISKSFWVHVLTADVTVEDQVIYLSDSVTAKDATITWQNECDEHKRTVAAEDEEEKEPLSYTVVFSEDGNTTSVDACGSYTAYLKVGNTVYKEEEFKDSFDVHVLEPQIKADSFAMYLSNNVNLNERQYITEWKCADKTEENVTAGRVKPPVAYDFYQNIAGTAEENTSAYAPSEDVTLTVVVKVNGNEYLKKYQGTFAIDVLEPIFSVNQKEVWANYLSNVEVYTQYGNEVKSVDWDSTTYAIVGEEPGNISCTFELKKIAGDGDWDKTDATKYQTGTNEDTFKVVKATWTYADGKSFVATGDRVKCNDLYDFVIHTNKFQLTIKTDWTESSGEQQSAIFTVTPSNQEDKNLKPITVAIPKGVNSVVITGLFSGQEYTIAEDNGWTWRYGTAAEAVGGPNIYCAGGFSLKALNGTDEVTMSFDDGETYNAKWLADEDCVINKLNKNGVAVARPVRTKEDYEEVTGA